MDVTILLGCGHSVGVTILMGRGHSVGVTVLLECDHSGLNNTDGAWPPQCT